MKRLGLLITAILIICPLALTACAEGGYDGYSEVTPTTPTAPAMPVTEPGKDIYYNGDEEYGIETPEIPTERIIVRNGSMSLVVADVIQSRDEIEILAANMGGWVVESNVYGEEEDMRAWISIRIPSEKFDQAMSQLRALAVRVSSENTSTQDITEEYVDLQSRLRNAEATEGQYLTLLETATEVDDILTIYQALSSIRYEIEQIKGRLQYLEQISALSLISIDLVPEVSLGPLVPPGWSASQQLNSAVRGLTTFGQGLGTAFIWIGIFSPIWGTILGITYWRRRKKRQKAANP